MGAPFPEEEQATAANPAKSHWAFQPVKAAEPPVTRGPAEHPIDRFVLAKLEAVKATMAPPADKRTIIRRVTYDLTGLPPTPAEVEAFEKDTRPDAYAKLVDRLLDSPHYGEHQARHWMDLARYSDTKGYVFTEDRNYPFAFTYRDWLIRSFNSDLPYDRFIRYQLAGDRLAKDDREHLAAMGFLTLGRRFLNNVHDIIDDRIDVTFRTFQGLTVTCARCHDHKYDPIPIKDYYSLYGVFASSQEPKDLPLLETPKDTPEVRAFDAELKKREEVVRASREKLRTDYLTKLKAPEAIAEYLRAARDARGNDGKARDRFAGLADERKLISGVIGSWKTYLEGLTKDEPVFAAYRELAAVPDAEFAAKSPNVLATIAVEKDPKKSHPAVAAALAAKKPQSFQDVCRVYGELLAKDNAFAAALGKGGPLDFDDMRFDRVINRKERDDLRNLVKKVDEWRAKSPAAPPRAMVMTDGNATQPVVFLRGNPNNRGPQVPRQFPELLAGPARKPFTDGSGRLEMATAISSADNPLTARVLVNRVWSHLFGQGLVRTPSDFGVRSDPPTHPELLDWLSARFVADGWSMKKLHRVIVTSQAYRQSSPGGELMAKDPENRLIGRMSRKRLSFEGLRDGLLVAADRLDRNVGGRSTDLFKAPYPTRRAVYGFIDRQNLPGTLRSFDFALPDTHAPQRFVTTVPQQALFLMNAPFVQEQAKALSARAAEPDPAKRVANLYRFAYLREPTAEEVRVALEFTAGPDDDKNFTHWDQLAQVLLLSNEFAFVD